MSYFVEELLFILALFFYQGISKGRDSISWDRNFLLFWIFSFIFIVNFLGIFITKNIYMERSCLVQLGRIKIWTLSWIAGLTFRFLMINNYFVLAEALLLYYHSPLSFWATSPFLSSNPIAHQWWCLSMGHRWHM